MLPWQQWLHECCMMLHYTYVAKLVTLINNPIPSPEAHAAAQVVNRPASQHKDPYSIRGHTEYELWWAKSHQEQFSVKYFVSPCHDNYQYYITSATECC
jgi:hypothetical protein